MALQPTKPGRRAKSGRGGSPASAPADTIYQVPDSDWDLLDVPLDQIDPNPFNDDRDMGDLTELAEDIKGSGLLEPISVISRELFVATYRDRFPDRCNLTKKYVIGYGERRWRASALAGNFDIKAIVRNDLVGTIRLDLIKENYHRKNPTELEQARNIHRLHVEDNMSYREIATALSFKSPGTITKRLRLLELPVPVQQAIEARTIGVTGALHLLELDGAERQLAALALVTEQGMSARDAVHHTSVHGVSLGNTERHDGDSAAEAEEPAVPIQREPETRTGGTDDEGEQASTPLKPRPVTPEVGTRKAGKAAPIGSHSPDRFTASKERELACVDMLRKGTEVSVEEQHTLIRRALLATKGDGRNMAHVWLIQSGRARFEIRDVDAYFQAVLSSHDSELIELATWVTALAANEARASDRRRPSWDSRDAEYVCFLMKVSGYVPETHWEMAELARLGVSLGNTPDPDNLTDQESL